jgi:AraC-like DNA-binding protein
MPVLPVPLIISLLLAGFLVHRLARRETHGTLLALIGICAVQAAIVSLVQYYGVSVLRPVQAVLATTIPPIAWLAFSRAAGGEGKPGHVYWHGLGPLLAVMCLAAQPMLLDVLIPLSFTAYGVAMLMRLWRGEDSLLHSPLESGTGPLTAWRILALSLIASAVCDVAIAIGLAFGQSGLLLWIPSVVSSISLLSLGALSLSRAMESRREADHTESAVSVEDAEKDQAIIAKLDELMVRQKPYLDPDLTLSRLARKIIVPAKDLSAAINRVKAENVSRYINRQRILHASALLVAGSSVTSAMMESGFNTKSNFNREFLRVMEKPPSAWLAARDAAQVR